MAKRKSVTKKEVEAKAQAAAAAVAAAAAENGGSTSSKKRKVVEEEDEVKEESEAKFIGEPVPDEEARQRWPKRYTEKVYIHIHCTHRILIRIYCLTRFCTFIFVC
jgi:hypothetical protein